MPIADIFPSGVNRVHRGEPLATVSAEVVEELAGQGLIVPVERVGADLADAAHCLRYVPGTYWRFRVRRWAQYLT